MLLSAHDFECISPPQSRLFPSDITGGGVVGDKSLYIDGLEPVAISNRDGEFEVAYSKPGLKILVLVEARAMAPTFTVIPAGAEHYMITLMDDGVVRERLIQNGKSVGNAEIGLIGRPRGGYNGNLQVTGYPYQEIRIGTQPDGSAETATYIPGVAPPFSLDQDMDEYIIKLHPENKANNEKTR